MFERNEIIFWHILAPHLVLLLNSNWEVKQIYVETIWKKGAQKYLRCRYKNATPNLCCVFCVLLGPLQLLRQVDTKAVFVKEKKEFLGIP